MEERDVTTNDIFNVIHWGEVTELEENKEFGNWICKVKGVDIEGETLVLVAAIDENEGSVLCITVEGD